LLCSGQEGVVCISLPDKTAGYEVQAVSIGRREPVSSFLNTASHAKGGIPKGDKKLRRGNFVQNSYCVSKVSYFIR